MSFSRSFIRLLLFIAKKCSPICQPIRDIRKKGFSFFLPFFVVVFRDSKEFAESGNWFHKGLWFQLLWILINFVTIGDQSALG